ncbi:hypothetical protein [Lacipirellula parvula]|uniref:Uncharacterized protein n=1 Tax=Lacipirellula parvula TaxID=2650471 RepID=A0A5K7XDJ6_9BACT|nr:hypothetical protein [Lacipirellula parvula]BBO34884.1 hypothetical protein PLANPX_4496 [Lacipirellula parvula]
MQALTTLLLAVHLLAMNVASTAPLAGAWLRRRSSRLPNDEGERRERLERGAQRALAASIGALAIGALVGGAMLLAPSAGMRAALARFPENTYWFAGAEILVSLGSLSAAWRLTRWPKMTWFLAIFATSNLVYHFPPLMGVIGELAANADWTDVQVIDRAALLKLWQRPEILSLWAHFALASVAVGCTAVLALAGIRPVSDSEADATTGDEDLTTRRLAAWALGATLLQIPVGIWLLLASDEAAQQSMMGENWLATIGLAGGVWVALGVMQSLAALAWGGSDRRQTYRACALLVLTVLLMSMTLRTSRQTGESPPSEPIASRP